MLNRILQDVNIRSADLNTSHVNVKLLTLTLHVPSTLYLNTSHVNVKSKSEEVLAQWQINLNTSHVNVKYLILLRYRI